MSPPRRRRSSNRSGQRRRSAPSRDFWGTADLHDQPVAAIRASEHPATLVRSLGPPPFPGGEVAPHYFDAVYDRAAALAVALAAAAGVFDAGDDDDAPGPDHDEPEGSQLR